MTDLFPNFKQPPKEHDGKTCRTCSHRFTLEYRSGKRFQYCGKQRNYRSATGWKKIKCKNPACKLYDEIDDVKNIYVVEAW